MRYYSTNGAASEVTLKEAIIKGLAPDKGLYIPESIKTLPAAFFKNIGGLSLQEIAYAVADSLFGEDVDADVLKRIVYDALNFDIPLHKVADRRYCLELYHGPTLAFKDVGARFMARMLQTNALSMCLWPRLAIPAAQWPTAFSEWMACTFTCFIRKER